MRLAFPALCCSVVSSALLLSSCVERRIWIETDPPGALVWINDAQAGRTPVDVEFTHHGTYDVRIEKEGYEPLVTGATTEGPVWDSVPIDFVVEVLPIRARSETRWRFTLVPRDDSEVALVGRAAALRERLRAEDARGGSTGEATREQAGEDPAGRPVGPTLEPSAVPGATPASPVSSSP